MSSFELVKAIHNRYFDELKGIATVVEKLSDTSDSATVNMLLEELNRRIKDMCSAIYEGGIILAKEVA